MLIICSSCNSKYLVNSADLKPNGRKVECAKCGNNWFQNSAPDEEEILSPSVPSTKDNNKYERTKGANLPSTIVKEEKVSVINSFLVLFFSILILIGFWFLKKNGINFFVLINYYLLEIYFNLQMIINDLAKIVFEILN